MVSIRPSGNNRCSSFAGEDRRKKEERIEVQQFLKKSSVLVKNEITELAKYSESKTEKKMMLQSDDYYHQRCWQGNEVFYEIITIHLKVYLAL